MPILTFEKLCEQMQESHGKIAMSDSFRFADIGLKDKLMDFLPEIKSEDKDILDKWIAHFYRQNEPFIVTRQKGLFKMWTMRKA